MDGDTEWRISWWRGEEIRHFDGVEGYRTFMATARMKLVLMGYISDWEGIIGVDV